MLCNACGATINEGADACPNCGAAVAETSASPEQAPDNQTGDAPTSYETTKLATEADAAPVACAVHDYAVATGACDTCGKPCCKQCLVSDGEGKHCQECSAALNSSASQTAAPVGAQQTAPASQYATSPVHRAPKKSGVGTGMIIAALLVIAIIGVGVWAYLKLSGPTPVKLTARDMELLLTEALGPSQLQMLSTNPEQKKELTKQLKRIFALAYEAEKLGLEKRPKVSSEIDFRTDQSLGAAYQKKNPTAKPSDEDVAVYLQAHPKEFDEFLEANPQYKRMTMGSGEEMKKEFGKLKVMAERARKDGLDKAEATKLMVLLQRSQALAQAYVVELQKPEIEQYYKDHKDELGQVRARHILIKTDPQDLGEAAPNKEEARKKAQSLLERVRNGEDFAALAQQNSDDEGSKVAGGDVGFFGRGSMVPQFEQAAFSLKPGEVSDLVETEYGFHIIKVEEQREPSLDDPEFQDQIVTKLDAGKLEKKIDEIAAASKVEVAEDFKIDAQAPAPPAFPQGGERPF
jgi:parvulin-like peptidyl-prolyl isomerase